MDQTKMFKIHNKNRIATNMDNTHFNLEQQFFTIPPQPDLTYIPTHIDSPRQHVHPILQTIPAQLQTTQNHLQSHNFNIINFFQQFKRIYAVSFNLHLQKNRLIDSMQEIQERIAAIDHKIGNSDSRQRDSKSIQNQKKEQLSEQLGNKRLRRTAQQIQKKYKCEVAYCQRYYGSQGSLQQHIKLKHPQLLKRDGEQFTPDEQNYPCSSQ